MNRAVRSFSQKALSDSGAVLREKATPVKAGLKTMAEA
jgi:hypothetical protein